MALIAYGDNVKVKCGARAVPAPMLSFGCDEDKNVACDGIRFVCAASNTTTAFEHEVSGYVSEDESCCPLRVAPSPKSQDGGLSVGGVVGVVVASLIVVAFLVVVALFCIKKRKEQRQQNVRD